MAGLKLSIKNLQYVCLFIVDYLRSKCHYSVIHINMKVNITLPADRATQKIQGFGNECDTTLC
jgi:hypothetical protein